MTEFIFKFLGTEDISQVLVPLLWAILAFIASLYIGVLRRNKGSDNTPYHFNWGFFIKDNVLRFMGTSLLLFMGIVFYQDIYGEPISSFKALALGFCSDQLVAYAKNIQKSARS